MLGDKVRLTAGVPDLPGGGWVWLRAQCSRSSCTPNWEKYLVIHSLGFVHRVIFMLKQPHNK